VPSVILILGLNIALISVWMNEWMNEWSFQPFELDQKWSRDREIVSRDRDLLSRDRDLVSRDY